MIHYRLDRGWDFGFRGVVGTLHRMDELVCFTLEPPLHSATHPAIPAGTYNLSWVKSPRLGHFTPRLNMVPKRYGILIHSGNTVDDTTGCILVGYSWRRQEETGGLWLDRSRLAKEKVYRLMANDLAGGYAEIEVKDGAIHQSG